MTTAAAHVTECAEGVFDCEYEGAVFEECAPYDETYYNQQGNGGLLGTRARPDSRVSTRSARHALSRMLHAGVATVVAALMCFMIGANDSANAWGSSVGSKAISLQGAVLIGGCAEWLGATLLGYGVSKTIQKGVAPTDDPECWACGYCDSGMPVYAVGMLCALIGAAAFLFLSTFAKLPVSTTHACAEPRARPIALAHCAPISAALCQSPHLPPSPPPPR